MRQCYCPFVLNFCLLSNNLICNVTSLVSLPWSRLGDAEVSCLGKVAAFEFENALLFKIKCVKALAERPESSLNFAYTNRTRCQESTVQKSLSFCRDTPESFSLEEQGITLSFWQFSKSHLPQQTCSLREWEVYMWTSTLPIYELSLWVCAHMYTSTYYRYTFAA